MSALRHCINGLLMGVHVKQGAASLMLPIDDAGATAGLLEVSLHCNLD